MNSIKSLIMTAKPVTSIFIALTMALVLIGASGAPSAQAKATVFTDNFQEPLDIIVFVDNFSVECK